MFRTATIPAAVLALALTVTSCATNPVTGKRELSLVTTADEAQMGKEGYTAARSEFGFYDDPAVQTYVNTVGQRVAKVSHLPNLQWTFTVVDDPAVNAFAMPGGYIYVTRGILAYLNSEAQLAAVLGHEIGHVTARHTARSITQQQLAGLGLGVVSIAVPGFARYGQAAQQGLQLMFLKYSRDHETQADDLGVLYSTAAGYDSREMPGTYSMLKRISDSAGSSLPTYMSTHPDPGQREQRTAAESQQATAGKTGLIIRRNDYIHQQDGIVFGQDPRQGYFEGSQYYHPGIAFQMTFPAGWKTQDSRQSVLAQSPDQASMIQLNLVDTGGKSPADYVAALQSAGKIGGAQGGNETIGGFPAWIGRLQAQDANGQAMVLDAAFIQKTPQQMFQVLGQPGLNESAILASARSFRPLSDPARLHPEPDRVKVVTAPRSGTFQQVISGLGPQAANVDQEAILNNTYPDQPVNAGELIKIVVPGHRH
jgi:predicted Zn-dependent protease